LVSLAQELSIGSAGGNPTYRFADVILDLSFILAAAATGSRAAYWFYKPMAPVCHVLNVGFGTDPPGGDLKYPEMSRQYFEDASAGATLIFQYYQNFH
jgi:hypothetical protein